MGGSRLALLDRFVAFGSIVRVRGSSDALLARFGAFGWGSSRIEADGSMMAFVSPKTYRQKGNFCLKRLTT
jgi:hypothetical protein